MATEWCDDPGVEHRDATARGRAPDVRPGPGERRSYELRGVRLLGATVDGLAKRCLAVGAVRGADRLQGRLDVGVADVLDVLGSGQGVDLGDEGLGLLVEKEGFDELFRAARIAERYDVAIMSTKGMSTTAARELVDRLGVPILHRLSAFK